MKKQLAYLPLEPLKSRYTELSSCKDGWFDKVFEDKFNLRRFDVPEAESVTVIKNGSVLDATNRPIHAMKQMIQLLASSYQGAVYLDDMFHPGVEALPYSGSRFSSIYSFCWAQSFDQYDFTRKMQGWMRPYEIMFADMSTSIFVASPLLKDLIDTSLCLPDYKVRNVGLPFDSKSVQLLYRTDFNPGPYDVVYSSRFDVEKNPGFFLDLVERNKDFKCVVCTGREELTGNDLRALHRAMQLRDSGRLTILTDLDKPSYYSVLRNSRVQFNCGMQDWVSFTLLEALTHGCLPCYPRHRDFCNVFSKAMEYTYHPFDLEEASAVVRWLLVDSPRSKALADILSYHDGTINRIADEIIRTSE